MPTPPGATRINATGTWIHQASGLPFPERIANYRRGAINQYDRRGTDVGVGYNFEGDDASVAFTVYVRPPVTLESGAPASLAEQFEIEKEVIRIHHPGTRESWVREESFLTEKIPVLAKSAEFEYTENFSLHRQPVISQLYLFEREGWFIKYRLTFAKDQEQQARQVARRMLEKAPWGNRAP